MRSLMIALCGSVPLLFGAGSFTVQDADLVFVSGPGPVQVADGTPIYVNGSEDGSPWQGLYTRNAGKQSIVFDAGVEGEYELKIWTVPSDAMNPKRQMLTDTVVIGEGGGGLGPFDIADLLSMMEDWGQCPGSGSCPFDLDGDGQIDLADMLIMLDNWK